jgi:hypothetical protein
VLATEPRLAGGELAAGSRAQKDQLISTLEERTGGKQPFAELHAITTMAMGWLSSAAHIFLTEDRPSLVDCFDDVVSICIDSTASQLHRAVPPAGRRPRRSAR